MDQEPSGCRGVRVGIGNRVATGLPTVCDRLVVAGGRTYLEADSQWSDVTAKIPTGQHEQVYQVITVGERDLEAQLNAAYQAGLDVVSTQVSSLAYGLGGEYRLKEVLVVLRRRG
jgi:hypothetical protein